MNIEIKIPDECTTVQRHDIVTAVENQFAAASIMTVARQEEGHTVYTIVVS